MEGHTEIVKFLAETNADLDSEMNDGATPIWIATLKDHKEIVKFLAKSNADLDRGTNDGATPILIAAYQSQRKSRSVFVTMMKTNKAIKPMGNSHHLSTGCDQIA